MATGKEAYDKAMSVLREQAWSNFVMGINENTAIDAQHGATTVNNAAWNTTGNLQTNVTNMSSGQQTYSVVTVTGANQGTNVVNVNFTRKNV
jgi:hypothetical protein